MIEADATNGGIIPARAGFTPISPPPGCDARDHPRSRGVYAITRACVYACTGSSPLARGLLDKHQFITAAWWIIPARAGFTDEAIPPSYEGWDHPRSRGVYRRVVELSLASPGSSPLARGLLVGQRPQEAPVRIIPARAGFTPGRPWLSPSATGSSPLARGLLRPAGVHRLGGGIIPARAGFTPRARSAARLGRDHPRSRGVYYDTRADEIAALGSSPLARGLHYPWANLMDYVGIIPARAGFTAGAGCVVTTAGDHPRSRGVYVRAALGPAERRGSSPLARGLRVARSPWGASQRIIPARAGFTSESFPAIPAIRDHPRSRGVYTGWRRGRRRPWGSSPLARGLRRCLRPGRRWRGIIPARAGFTH